MTLFLCLEALCPPLPPLPCIVTRIFFRIYYRAPRGLQPHVALTGIFIYIYINQLPWSEGSRQQGPILERARPECFVFFRICILCARM